MVRLLHTIGHMKFEHLLSWSVRVTFLCAVTASALACSADASDDGTPTGESNDRLSAGSCDRAAFADCVNNDGGGGCAKYCSGPCKADVEICARSGGRHGCVNNCTGAETACSPREEIMSVATWECGVAFGWGGHTSALPGRAMATCMRQCNGNIDNCQVWHYKTGRAQCTQGGPLDVNQNPW